MSVYKDEKTGKWFSQFRYKTWQGEIKRSTKRGFATKREAVQWEREFILKQKNSICMTFRQFVKRYEEDMMPRLKESTCYNKRRIFECKLIPYFGEKRLDEITTTDIIQWQNEMFKYRDKKTGMGHEKSYIRILHKQLSAVFNHAVRYYGLSENPARIVGNVGPPKETKMKFWTLEEYKRFSEAMVEKPQSYYLFQVLYWTGMRIGEALALTPNDINFVAKTISIDKTYYRLDGVDLVTSPKTQKSVRTILIPDFLCQELEDLIKLSFDIKADERIFNVSRTYVKYELLRGIKEKKLERIRIHDLRHSHVSLLIDMGYSAVAIAERIGHESIDITYRYAHMFPTVQNDMVNKLNMLWEGKNEREE